MLGDSVRVGVVGAGYFGAMHARIYQWLPTADLVAVADTDPVRAARITHELGCEACRSHEELIARSDVDAVDVVVPDDVHADVVLAVLRAAKHVLVEKPLADNLRDLERIASAAKAYPAKLMVGHILRFDVKAATAYRRIQRGDIGDVLHVVSRRNSPITAGRYYAARCHLATHSAVHDLDLARWLVGSDYRTAYAKGRKKILVREGRDTYDSILALLEFENGVVHSLETCWTLTERSPAYIDAKLEVVGAKGTLLIDAGNQGLDLHSDAGAEFPDVTHWPVVDHQIVGDLREELMQFVECIRCDRPVPVTVDDGIAAAKAALGIVESLGDGRIVTL